MKYNLFAVPAIVVGLTLSAIPAAQADMPKEDTIKGAKDHPMLTRFAESKLVGYNMKEYDEVEFPVDKKSSAWKESGPVLRTTTPRSDRASRSCATIRQPCKRPV